MIVDAYTFCWNEEIRLKYYLHLYAPICRKIVIYDNGSTDSSQEIASQYNNVIWNSTKYGQNEINDGILRDLKNSCWKQSHDADWVIVGDVDEILYHKNGLKSYLFYTLHETRRRILRSTGYDMVSTTLPTHNGNIYDHEQFQYGSRNVKYDKTLVFCPSIINAINYTHGAHEADPSSNKLGIRSLKFHNPELKLLHYKYISQDYFIFKQKQNGKRLSDVNLSTGRGKEYLLSEEQLIIDFNNKKKNSVKII